METDYEFTWIIPSLRIQNLNTCYSNGEQYYVHFYDYPYFDDEGNLDITKSATSIDISLGADITPATYNYSCHGKNEEGKEWFLEHDLPQMRVRRGAFYGKLEILTYAKDFPTELEFLRARIPEQETHKGRNLIYLSEEEKNIIDDFVKPLVKESFGVMKTEFTSNSPVYVYNGEHFEEERKYNVLNNKSCHLIYEVKRLHFEQEESFLKELKNIIYDTCVIYNDDEDYDEGFDDLEESTRKHKRRLRY